MDTKLVISELMVDMLKQFSSEDRGKRELETQKGSIQKVMRIVVQAPVVRRLDNTIHWINRYPVDSVVRFVNTYPLDSVIRPSNNWDQEITLWNSNSSLRFFPN